MTAPTGNASVASDGAPPLRVLLTATLLAAVVGAVLVTLYALSPEPRPPLVQLCKDLAPYLGGVGSLAVTVLYGGRIKRETSAQTQTLAKIDAQTNGVLELRMEKAAARALMRAGLLQEQRAVADMQHVLHLNEEAAGVPAQRDPSEDLTTTTTTTTES